MRITSATFAAGPRLNPLFVMVSLAPHGAIGFIYRLQ
jgi:hypothetical protein